MTCDMSPQEEKIPATSAVRFLRERKIPFQPHFYRYEEHGGTAHAARSLGVSEHAVIKTLVMETGPRDPLVTLMHGDCEVSTKQLARTIGTSHVTPCDEQTAHRHTGYTVGGISPFGTRSELPVYAEETIFDLPLIFINGGKRGFLVSMNPMDLKTALPVALVHVSIPKHA
jgi:Cys-tRNA(Pro) deacylase